ncbi:hypothetical protein, conserved [Babesia bigemina]|uniref:Protein ARV n=1 Tax=Babesia bigemina TaxID=5866 RepID=A0A061DAF1_BABBI|nr:hypothetical protein, conserved [Babesia bigemina]CDR97528.1 hypothetical protein, conserved [Babesia bigemina]|eukprot:XP_012769714.1 hypothetical protein, conserved [Babesia bigemina]
MVVCVHCSSLVPTLYHESSKESICLETCAYCGEIADKYVEWDLYITAIELFLLKVAVFRHLIYNQDAKPSGGKNGTSARKRISHLLLLFASAVVLDGYRVMVTCRFITKSQEWCSDKNLMLQQAALEKAKEFFQGAAYPTLMTAQEAQFSADHVTPFTDIGSTTNLFQNMVQSMLASSQMKIISARKEMGMCDGSKPSSIVDQFFILSLQEPSLMTMGYRTCKTFGEWSTLLLCLTKLAGYCASVVIFQKVMSRHGYVSPSNNGGISKSVKEKINATPSTLDVLLAVLLCIHIKALVLMMIIWYPRLPLVGAIEVYAYCSNALAIHATCNMTMKQSSMAVAMAILIKLLIHCIWLRSQY